MIFKIIQIIFLTSIIQIAFAQKGTMKITLRNETDLMAQKFALSDDTLILFSSAVQNSIHVPIKEIQKLRAQKSKDYRFLYTTIGIVVGVLPGVYAITHFDPNNDVVDVSTPLKAMALGSILGGSIGYLIANEAFVKININGDKHNLEKQKDKLKQFVNY
jgi:hypothetical protein